jgi:anti-sigma factor RsiW
MIENRKDKTAHQEELINALLDGDLDSDEAEALKAEATGDQRLARAIIEAYQLQRAMEHVQVETAPASLRRKLRRVPREHRPMYLQPRFAMAMAVVPLLVVSMVLMQTRQPSQAEIEQARQQLAIAFAYIDQVSDRTFDRIGNEVGGELKDAVGGSVIRSIPKPKSVIQEEQA